MTDKPQVIAMAALIGPPPITVNSVNRGNVRKWCRAKGVASRVVENLVTESLASAYNDPSFLAYLLTMTPPPKPRPAPMLPLDMEQLTDLIRLTVSDILAELREAHGDPVTEERVRELAREVLKGKVR
ncbi:hypothetical protein [Pseudomonas sp. BF-R-21]|uniref:hypothetical protein n=1 Tax=Pseudomonas sp. BF-R-21 TaxID=2832387 RepID=UPI001CBC1725|nr:hypothetical protein [Pseudomonas sp. BF-R-21]